jgi:hypothetical protein
MSSVSGLARRMLGTIAMASVASAAVGCAGETSPSDNRTTLYIYADYASPNVTVSVNGASLGTIVAQYTGAPDCTVLAGKGIADGVVSTPIAGGLHYAINWTFSSGKADADSFDATADFFAVPCLLEPIEAPAASIIPSGTIAVPRIVSGRDP